MSEINRNLIKRNETARIWNEWRSRHKIKGKILNQNLYLIQKKRELEEKLKDAHSKLDMVNMVASSITAIPLIGTKSGKSTIELATLPEIAAIVSDGKYKDYYLTRPGISKGEFSYQRICIEESLEECLRKIGHFPFLLKINRSTIINVFKVAAIKPDWYIELRGFSTKEKEQVHCNGRHSIPIKKLRLSSGVVNELRSFFESQGLALKSEMSEREFRRPFFSSILRNDN